MAVGNNTIHGNLTLRVATNAPLCNTLPSNNISPKTVKILALKGLTKYLTKLEKCLRFLSYQDDVNMLTSYAKQYIK